MRLVPLGINLTATRRGRRGTRRAVHDRLLRARRAGEGPARARRGVSPAAHAAGPRRVARSSSAGYLAPSTRRISTASGAMSRAWGLGGRVRVSRRARSRAEDRVPARASTCCRCRRPTTSRRACSCSRRWPAACRSCSRGAARFPEIVERTGGGLLVDAGRPRGARRRAARRSGAIPRARRRSARAARPACASTTASTAWPRRSKRSTSELIVHSR